MYKKHIIGLFIGLVVGMNCFSQVELGGTIGFGITNNCMTIDLNPEAALALGTNKNFKLGFSPFFMYNKILDFVMESIVTYPRCGFDGFH